MKSKSKDQSVGERKPVGTSLAALASRSDNRRHFAKLEKEKLRKNVTRSVYKRIAKREEKEGRHKGSEMSGFLERQDAIEKELAKERERNQPKRRVAVNGPLDEKPSPRNSGDHDDDGDSRGGSESENDGEVGGAGVVAPRYGKDDAKRFNPFEKAKKEYEKEAEVKKEQALEHERAIMDQKLKMKENRRDRMRASHKLSQRTARGQPVMANIVQHLLEKIQRNDEKDKQDKQEKNKKEPYAKNTGTQSSTNQRNSHSHNRNLKNDGKRHSR
eukprot:ANDGO_07623.mRNA.1 hypothetical protein